MADAETNWEDAVERLQVNDVPSDANVNSSNTSLNVNKE